MRLSAISQKCPDPDQAKNKMSKQQKTTWNQADRKFQWSEFSRTLSKIRIARGLSIRQAAGVCPFVSASTISRIEAGGFPDFMTFIALCNWMSKSPNQFIR